MIRSYNDEVILTKISNLKIVKYSGALCAPKWEILKTGNF